MRVITGSARGRKLFSPEDICVRPTTDKVKEAIFNIVQFDIPSAAVLDLFAGSGQLGIEALSRGAKKAVFADSSKKALKIVKKNIELCGLSEKAQVVFSDAFSFLASCTSRFDVIFLDPPYHRELCGKALKALSSSVGDSCVAVCETQFDECLPERTDRLKLDREYLYSAIKLSVYRTFE